MKRQKTRTCGACNKRYTVYDWNTKGYPINAIRPMVIMNSGGEYSLGVIHLCRKCCREFVGKYMEGDNGKM